MQLINAFQYLEKSSELFPEKLAIYDDNTRFTYSSLFNAVTSVGTMLYSMIKKTRERIFVLVDRNAVSLVGIFSVLAAGSCYVPVDSKMPQERMDDIFNQVSPAAILYCNKDVAIAERYSDRCNLLCIDDNLDNVADNHLLSKARDTVIDIDPAYMIFTSGSTGKPKGIMISHRSLIDFTEWMTYFCEINSDSIMANQAPFYFDLSVKDIYQTVKNGATLYILQKKYFSFPLLLVKALNDNSVNTLIWATSAFRIVADSKVFDRAVPSTVKKVILGGEALQAHHVNIWKKAVGNIDIINLYGPTEVTVDCTSYRIERDFEDGEPIPIGKACRNMEVILLDDDLNPVSSGEAGEICVRGTGLALGYFNDHVKTSESFVQNPLNSYYPDRIYRTGDIGRTDDDGNIIYLCRKDGQIKHMGYRIELGEIETSVGAVPGVDVCVCFFDDEIDMIICCIQSGTDGMDPSFLTEQVKNRLPKYMMPNIWKIYRKLPYNANGKIDRVKLKDDYYNEQN